MLKVTHVTMIKNSELLMLGILLLYFLFMMQLNLSLVLLHYRKVSKNSYKVLQKNI